MFSQDDFDRFEKNFGEVPDGLLDASEYAQTFSLIVDLIDELPANGGEDQVAHAHFMMKIVNHIHKENGSKNEIDNTKALDCVTTMCYHLLAIFNAMYDIIPDFKDQYVQHLRKDVLPGINENFGSIPYWE